MAETTPTIDPSLIGNIINAIPLSGAISGFFTALIKAGKDAADSYAAFLMSVCFDKEGKAFTTTFSYDETIDDGKGSVVVQKKTLSIPNIALIHHPAISIKDATFDFEMVVNQAISDTSSLAYSADGSIGLNIGPFSLALKGGISGKSDKVRSSDQRGRLSVHIEVENKGMPEGVARVCDALLSSAIPKKV